MILSMENAMPDLGIAGIEADKNASASASSPESTQPRLALIGTWSLRSGNCYERVRRAVIA
jgi:hypothetical protein